MAIDGHLFFSLYNSSAVKDGQGWKLEDQRRCGRSPQDHGRGDEAAQDRLRWVDVDGKQGVIITLSMLSPKTNIPTHFLLKRAAYNIFVTVGWHSPGSATLFFFGGKVYDVSGWNDHPGGSVIFTHAGDDMTDAFNLFHPPTARAALDQFYIGEVGLRAVRLGEGTPSSHGRGELILVSVCVGGRFGGCSVHRSWTAPSLSPRRRRRPRRSSASSRPLTVTSAER